MNNLLPTPGDLFNWRYIDDPYTMPTEGDFYSGLMCGWIPIVGIHLCVGFFDNVIYWISKQMLFCARTNELGWKSNSLSARVTPRKIQLRTRVKHER